MQSAKHLFNPFYLPSESPVASEVVPSSRAGRLQLCSMALPYTLAHAARLVPLSEPIEAKPAPHKYVKNRQLGAKGPKIGSLGRERRKHASYLLSAALTAAWLLMSIRAFAFLDDTLQSQKFTLRGTAPVSGFVPSAQTTQLPPTPGDAVTAAGTDSHAAPSVMPLAPLHIPASTSSAHAQNKAVVRTDAPAQVPTPPKPKAAAPKQAVYNTLPIPIPTQTTRELRGTNDPLPPHQTPYVRGF